VNYFLLGDAGPAWWTEPLLAGVVLGAVGLWLMLPRGTYLARAAGSLLGMIGFGCIAAAAPWSLGVVERIVFWGLALVTLSGAAATVSMRSPVYSAIWFSFSLLGASGLFFFQGAQFIGVANMVVYAGAIVVTFLFVLMLAQPEGMSIYDRMSWGWFPKLLAVTAGSTLVVLLTLVMLRPPLDLPRWQVAQALPLLTDSAGHRLLRDDQLVETQHLPRDGDPVVRITLRGDLPADALALLYEQFPAALEKAAPELAGSRLELLFLPAENDILHQEHMAHLGAELFSRHLLAIELVGTVLLAALIGAVTIVSHGSPRRSSFEKGRS
jgi:NADH-quinone oxidoreductase subunit J